MKPNPNVLFRRIGNEVVLYNLQSDRFYELSATAARFWELLHENKNPAQIREKLLEEFSVNAARLDEEATTLVDSLQREDLITH